MAQMHFELIPATHNRDNEIEVRRRNLPAMMALFAADRLEASRRFIKDSDKAKSVVHNLNQIAGMLEQEYELGHFTVESLRI